MGVIGYPISHSLSPPIQQAAFDHYGLPVLYEAWKVLPEELQQWMGTLRRPEVIGCNVTLPHKEAVIQCVDQLTAEALEIGAVNTIFKEQGRHLVGHNTDAAGFLRSLHEEASFHPKGARVVLLGAGGAAKAVATALAREGVGELHVFNRHEEKARALATRVSEQYPGVAVQAHALQEADDPSVVGDYDLFVNATSVGLEAGQCPVTGRALRPGSLIMDLVYNPPLTPLLQLAREVGARTLGGLAMLVYQAAESFQVWTGKQAPVDAMFWAAEKALGPSVSP